MGLRDIFSNYVMRQVEKRGLIEDIVSGSVRFGGVYVTNENILKSSDVYELMQDISNQVMLADLVIEDEHGNELKEHKVLNHLKRPNFYLTQSELIKLMTNVYLLDGEVFPTYDGDQIHLASGVETKIDDRLIEHFKIGGTEIPQGMISWKKKKG